MQFNLINYNFTMTPLRNLITKALERYYLRTEMLERYVLEVERIVGLFANIKCSVGLEGMCVATVVYVHSHLQKPMSYMAAEICHDFQDLEIFSQIKGFVAQSGETECNWVRQFKALYSEFKIYRDSTFASSVTQLLNYIVSIGLCNASQLTFSAGNLQLFAPIAYSNQISASSFADAIVGTVCAFLEGGYRVYTTGQLSAFFYCENEIVEFERKYAICNDYAGYISTGNLLEMKQVTDDEYMDLISKAIEMGTKLLESMIFKKDKNSPEKASLDRKLFSLRNWRSDYEQSKVRGDMRESPFAISFYGESGVGKTALASVSITTIGLYNNIDVSAEKRQTWADNDKFASNIRSSTNVIQFDDMANTKAEFVADSPTYHLIQTINNALFLAPMAEAHMKGKVALRPRIVTVTTNKRNLDAPVYSNKPESVLRRLYHVTVRLDPEYKRIDGMIDEEKVTRVFGTSPAPDIWLLDVTRCVIKGVVGGRTTYDLLPFCWTDPSDNESYYLENIRVGIYLRWLQHASKAHYIFQKEFVKNMKPNLGLQPCSVCGLYLCDTCSLISTQDVNAEHHLPLANAPIPGVILSNVPGHDIVTDIALLHDDLTQSFDGENASFCQQSGLVTNGVHAFYNVVRLVMSIVYIVLSCVAIHIMRLVLPRRWLDNCAHIVHAFSFRWYRLWVSVIFANTHGILETCRNVRRISTIELVAISNNFRGSWLDWICYVPPSIINSRMLRYTYLVARVDDVFYSIAALLGVFTFVCIFMILSDTCPCKLIAFLWVTVVYFSISTYYLSEKYLIERELESRSDRAPAVVKYLRERYLQILIGSALAATICKVLSSIWRTQIIFREQGNINPTSMEQIYERDKEINDWAIAVPRPIPLNERCRTTCGSDLARICGRSTFYVESLKPISDQPWQMTRAFAVRSNVVLVPKHFIEANMPSGVVAFRMRIFTGPSHAVGNSFVTTVSNSCMSHLNIDATMIYIPELGSRKDVFEYFPDVKTTRSSRAIFVYRAKDFAVDHYNIRFEVGQVPYGSRKCDGGTYILPRLTENGMCMSPIVSNELGTYILGFHIGGQPNGAIGCGQTILRGDVEDAYSRLMSNAHILRVADEGVMLEEQFGVKIVDAPLHYKSAVNFLDRQDCHVEVFGGHSVRSTPHSNVVTSIISKHVEEVLGVPQQWGPPKLAGGYYPYQVALNNIAHQSLEIGDEIIKATLCYQDCFNNIGKGKTSETIYAMRPLNDIEIVSGIDGCRFIDPMNLSTSPGFPFTKDKKELVEEVSNVGDAHSCPRRFVAEIRKKICEAEDVLAQRLRIYVPWKAALKDEPTKLTKTKTRVFECAPLIIQAILRKYYLPVVRVMQLHSIKTECAVGCNAEGTEWEQLYTYMMKFPNKFGGDYSEYDQRMPAQLICAAFKVLISVAKMSEHYTQRDITIMESVVSEVVNPIIIYDGAVLMLFGSNPSGQNLTVIINCIVNSILLRCAYYSKYPNDKIGSFRKYVAIQTYGDDVLGSVSSKRKLFNVVSVSDYLAKYNIKFTSPSKEKAECPFLRDDELEFLKRTNYYNSDLGCNVGILAEKSIYKRLHCHVTSKYLNMEQQSAENIDTSLKDFFYFGRDKYDEMLCKLKEVATRANIDLMCRGFVDYDERVVAWKEKYTPQKIPPKSIGGP